MTGVQTCALPILGKARKEESGHKVINLTIAFGNASLTYPSGGIPLTSAKLGCPNNIVDLVIDGPSSGDGLVYKYDKANNKIRIYPAPQTFGNYETKYWFRFSIDSQDATTDAGQQYGSNVNGVNNVNTLPFSNIPYENINSMGKQ